MKRRDFITLLGGAAITWPFGARGQQLDRVPRIGILSLTAASDTRVQGWLAAIRQRLPELGWAEGSVRIDYRWGMATSIAWGRLQKNWSNPVPT